MTMCLMSAVTKRCEPDNFDNMKKIQQEDILMVKSLQPSVGVMKWPALAEDLDDLSPTTPSICCAVESKSQPLRC